MILPAIKGNEMAVKIPNNNISIHLPLFIRKYISDQQIKSILWFRHVRTPYCVNKKKTRLADLR
jgi:hypothetical protein